MASSALHAIAIEKMRYSNPLFYSEYCLLIEGISAQIRELAKKRVDYLDYSSFIESYDSANHEPVLQVIVGAQKTELCIHIHIHKDYYFVFKKSGNSIKAFNAQEVLTLIIQNIRQIGI